MRASKDASRVPQIAGLVTFVIATDRELLGLVEECETSLRLPHSADAPARSWRCQRVPD